VREGLKEGDRVVVSLDREEVKGGARAKVKGEQTESRTKSGLSK